MDEQRKQLETALKKWSDSLAENTEERIRVRFVRLFASFSDPMDRYASWFMLGTAAAMAALLSSLQTAQEVVGESALKTALLLLIMSLLLGILQKILAFRIQIWLRGEIEGEAVTEEERGKHNKEEQEIRKMAADGGIEIESSLNVLRAVSSYQDLLPEPFRWQVRRLVKRIISDNDYLRRKALSMTARQSVYISLQIFLSLVALAVMAISIQI